MIICGDENLYPREIYASITRHKVPRYFMFVNEFSMNAADKMRDESAEKLGLKK